jgi:dihydrofolate reductase
LPTTDLNQFVEQKATEATEVETSEDASFHWCRLAWISDLKKSPFPPFTPVQNILVAAVGRFVLSVVHRMHVSIIVAVAENGVIGRGGQLPWRLLADLQRFKQLTMGHTIIMGRRTWKSIGRALPGRKMMVVTRQHDYHIEVTGVAKAASLGEAIEHARIAGDDEAFIIGGAELYREALAKAQRLYYTRILAAVAGDTQFPTINWNEWRLIESTNHPADTKNDYPCAFEVYERH